MKKYILLLITMIILSGCASIVSKSSYNVMVQSSSEKTNFVVKNTQGFPIHKGQTPMMVHLDSGDGYFNGATYTIEYEKNGKRSFSTINATLDPWYIGNIFVPWGLILGMLIIDPITGSMWKLPNNAYGNL